MWKSLCKCSKNKEYSYIVYDSIADLDQEKWDSVNTNDNIYLSSTYLNAFELSMRNTYAFRYFLFFNDKKDVVGIGYSQIVAFKPVELLQEKIPCSIAENAKNFFGSKELNLLICGNLFACGENGYAHTSQISNMDFIDILSDALADLRKLEEKKISFLLFKEFWPDNDSPAENLREQSYKELSIDVNMVLSVAKEWETFEDYLGSMKTKYRTRAKNVFKSSTNLVVKNFTCEEISENLELLQSMYIQVLKNADYNLGVLDANTFYNLKKGLKEKFIMKGYFLEEKLIGFSSAFAFNGTIDANFVGIDYEYNKTHKVYQRMLYDFVALAIHRKSYELRLGRTAETIKSVVGAEPIAMKLFAKHRKSLPTSVLGRVFSSIKPSEFEVRKPFKN